MPNNDTQTIFLIRLGKSMRTAVDAHIRFPKFIELAKASFSAFRLRSTPQDFQLPHQNQFYGLEVKGSTPGGNIKKALGSQARRQFSFLFLFLRGESMALQGVRCAGAFATLSLSDPTEKNVNSVKPLGLRRVPLGGTTPSPSSGRRGRAKISKTLPRSRCLLERKQQRHAPSPREASA